jgi:O-acetyl-ADP-ribose deacetylase (regulator of RNase III)
MDLPFSIVYPLDNLPLPLHSALMLPEKVTLIDIHEPLVTYWNEVFKDEPRVSAEWGDYFETKADAMVSPANSFGIMDGGIDLAIRNELGRGVELTLRSQIEDRFHGELPVGGCIIIDTDYHKWPYLVCAPTMRTPGNCRDTTNAYTAFRAALLAIKRFNEEETLDRHPRIRSLVCCGLATGCGKMTFSRCAVQMKAAWDQVNGSPKLGSFDEIHAKNRLLFTM